MKKYLKIINKNIKCKYTYFKTDHITKLENDAIKIYITTLNGMKYSYLKSQIIIEKCDEIDFGEI